MGEDGLNDREAGDRAAAPHSGGHRRLYRRARLPAVGPRDRRTGRAFVVLDDPRPSQGAGAARAHLARSHQAAGPPLGLRARCVQGDPRCRRDADPRQGRGRRADHGAGKHRRRVRLAGRRSCRGRPTRSCCACRAIRWSTRRFSTAISSWFGRSQTADNGEIVVAMLDGEATVKRFYREKRPDPLAAGESDDGANLRERCRDHRPRRSRRPPPLSPERVSLVRTPRRAGDAPAWRAAVRRGGSRRAAMELHRTCRGLHRDLLPFSSRAWTVAGRRFGLRVASALLAGLRRHGDGAGRAFWPLRLRARDSTYRRYPLLAGSVAAFVLSLPRPFGPDVVAYLARARRERAFSRDRRRAGSPPAWIAFLRRASRIPLRRLARGSVGASRRSQRLR